MTVKTLFSMLFSMALGLTLTGCAASNGGNGGAPISASEVQVLSDYANNTFDKNGYLAGMEKSGHHNVFIWVDPTSNMAQYKSINLGTFGTRLLPEQTKFSYDTFAASFNGNLKNAVALTKSTSPSALKVVGEIVTCNPGSRAARYWVGMGAGKAVGAVACDIYEPGKSKPSMRLYAWDTASVGGFGGDSFGMLNHIFNQIAFHMANTMNARIGR